VYTAPTNAASPNPATRPVLGQPGVLAAGAAGAFDVPNFETDLVPRRLSTEFRSYCEMVLARDEATRRLAARTGVAPRERLSCLAGCV
jgi:hypothetical protein